RKAINDCLRFFNLMMLGFIMPRVMQTTDIKNKKIDTMNRNSMFFPYLTINRRILRISNDETRTVVSKVPKISLFQSLH
ncbi:TPA: hypothetical protein ACKREJ_001381, partial [Proteus mirabilis]